MMSPGDLSNQNIFSLEGELRADRFGSARIADQQVEIWPMYLEEMRWCWERGEATEGITDFFEYFNPTDKPSR